MLERALKSSTSSSNAPLSSASRSSHDQIRGEAHASDDGDGGEPRQAQAGARASADGPIRQPQAGGRRRAALAGTAGGARSALTELMARLILDHAATADSASSNGGRPMMSDKIRPHHLDRKAILYVRQSSSHQVLHNRESRALQYAMRDRLTALGWSRDRDHRRRSRPLGRRRRHSAPASSGWWRRSASARSARLRPGRSRASPATAATGSS